MMDTPTYSEQDIQDYASGSYAGDVPAFEAYLQQHPAALAQVEQYRQLFNLLQTEAVPSLSFNLADKVLSKTHQNKFAPEPTLMRFLPYILIAVGVLAAVITLQYFSPRLPVMDFTLVGASAIIMVIFLTAFHHIEMKRRQEYFTA